MDDFFYLMDGDDYIQILFATILYIEAGKKYSTLFATDRTILIAKSLDTLERALPGKLFCRIHRSYIISLSHTTSFNQKTATVANKKIPIGKQYRPALIGRTFPCNERHVVKLSDFDFLKLFKGLGRN
jgi:DNA-binding LytR/AlgR family response regulator